MKATQKRDKVNLEMSTEEAQALLEFVNSEARRRAMQFDRTGIMDCWGCQGTALRVSEALSDAGITPYCSGG